MTILEAGERGRLSALDEPPAGARRFVITGRVQGVGFRPFVHAVARRLGLGGHVRNRGAAVEIVAAGDPDALDAFTEALHRDAPPLARVRSIESRELAPSETPAPGPLRILESAGRSGGREVALFAPDVAVCSPCLAEVDDPADRRAGHPFASCTDCGPRYTIATAAPFDRERTTMAPLPRCARCDAEYGDPSDRRHHAQTVACPDCGPRLALVTGDGERQVGDPIELAARRLARGGIVAVKGIGGYHLAVDATDEDAVATLRRRKARDARPFAVLVADLAAARALGRVGSLEERLLASAVAPIVLLDRAAGSSALAPSVAPGVPGVGVMLPSTPLHHLLARRVGRPLVLTSGNLAGEPIVLDDADARERLGAIADALLVHDRAIRVRCDDSVVRPIAGGPCWIRRSRGRVPAPITLPRPLAAPTLAAGGHQKAVIALGAGDQATPGPHVGDLDSLRAVAALDEALAHALALGGPEPSRVVHDAHPGYASTAWARALATARGLETIAVQHHHAHVAAAMAEHGLVGPVIGVALDGAGWGPDGTVWGGEILVADLARFRRAAHLRTVPQPGGDRAAREPWRMAVVHLDAAGIDVAARALGRRAAPRALAAVRRMAARGVNAPLTSSAGRLFDAVAAIVVDDGSLDRIAFEGQAAVRLEALALTDDAAEPFPFAIDAPDGDVPLRLDPRPLVAAAARAVDAGAPRARIARRFHLGLAAMLAAAVGRIRAADGPADVVLTGGCFQNALLTEETARRLRAAGLTVHLHRELPPNDGGLCVGQLAVVAGRDAAARARS